MLVAVLIGVVALVLAVLIVGSATRKHQREGGLISTWTDVKEAFNSDALRDVRKESAMLSQPSEQETDLGISDLLDLSEEGSGYVNPRDILALRAGRD